jgi:hypothetical protein
MAFRGVIKLFADSWSKNSRVLLRVRGSSRKYRSASLNRLLTTSSRKSAQALKSFLSSFWPLSLASEPLSSSVSFQETQNTVSFTSSKRKLKDSPRHILKLEPLSPTTSSAAPPGNRQSLSKHLIAPLSNTPVFSSPLFLYSLLSCNKFGSSTPKPHFACHSESHSSLTSLAHHFPSVPCSLGTSLAHEQPQKRMSTLCCFCCYGPLMSFLVFLYQLPCRLLATQSL